MTIKIVWAVFALLVFISFFLMRKRLKEKNVWNILVNKYKDSVNEKIKMEAAFVNEYGNIENKSLFYRLDRLILTSGIKKHIKWLSGEKFLLILGVSFIFGSGLATVIVGNLFVSLFVGAVLVVALYVVVIAMAGKTYNATEDSTSIFVSILSNHAKTSSDIETIMENTRISLEGPIRHLVDQFLRDCERTGNIDLAFDYMKESTDNRQLRAVITNLKNCMHYQANYEEVLAQMKGQITASLSAREDRKNILFSMKLTLTVISIASVLIVWIIGQGIGVDVKAILTGNLFGQSILFVTGILYLFVAVKLFGTDK